MAADEILLGDIYGKLLLVKLVYRKSSNATAEQTITDLHVTDLGDVSSSFLLLRGRSALLPSPLGLMIDFCSCCKGDFPNRTRHA